MEKLTDFVRLKQNVRSGEFTVVQLLLFQSVDVCGVNLDMA